MKQINLKNIRMQRIKKRLDFTERIEVNLKVAFGKPVIKGTRITVDFILNLFGQGITQEEILKEFPQLEKEDLLAVLKYAQRVVQEEYVYPLSENKTKVAVNA